MHEKNRQANPRQRDCRPARHDENDSKLPSTKTKTELVGELERDITVLRIFTAIGSLGASILVSYGFRLWYKRVQKPMDIITTWDALEVNKEKAQGTSTWNKLGRLLIGGLFFT